MIFAEISAVGVSPCAYPPVNRTAEGGCPCKNPQNSLKNQKNQIA